MNEFTKQKHTGDGAMFTIPISSELAKLPVGEIEATIERVTRPIQERLPDQRLKGVVSMAVECILATETPVITAMVRAVSRKESECWAAAKRIYRFLDNDRFDHQAVFEGLYGMTQTNVASEQPGYLVVAVDPVNFEKPYTEKLEGVSTVYKSTPPDLNGGKRLAHGYPAITASVVNTRVPGVSYANWFSYKLDFISQNHEIHQSIQTTRRLFPEYRLRFVMDSGMDDQKIFAWLDQPQVEFAIPVKHWDRWVEVYNTRLGRWEREQLGDLVESLPLPYTFQADFHHAGVTQRATLSVGAFLIRLPDTHQRLWVLVAENNLEDHTLALLTNIPLDTPATLQQVYADWRLRGRIEHGYRFDQEQGLDVEDLRVQTLEHMRRLFALVLTSAQLVFHIMVHWPPQAVTWLRELGGKLGLSSDRDGPYILLRGIAMVLLTAATCSFALRSPFPHHVFDNG
jgi:hypothetical protein